MPDAADIKFGDFANAVHRGRRVAGRVVAAGASGCALMQLACGRSARCHAVQAFAGAVASVCEIVANRANFYATAKPARVTVVVGGQAATLSIDAAALGKRFGWKGSRDVHLEVAGRPHLCRVAVTVTALDSETWDLAPVAFDDDTPLQETPVVNP